VIEIKSIQDLFFFYLHLNAAMKEIYADWVKGTLNEQEQKVKLSPFIKSLEQYQSGNKKLELYDGFYKNFNLNPELNTLQAEIAFLDSKESWLNALHKGELNINKQVKEGLKWFAGKKNLKVVADRDGSLLPLKTFYWTSVQSAAHAITMHRFIEHHCNWLLWLSSAPLNNIGIEDLTITRSPRLAIAGDNGAQFKSPSGEYFEQSTEKDFRKIMDAIFDEIIELTDDDQYSVFRLINPGIQKFSNRLVLTVRDNEKEIPEDLSNNFRDKLINIVKKVDPNKKTIRFFPYRNLLFVFPTKDKGLITNKADGLNWILSQYPYDIKTGNLLVIGDSKADVYLLKKALQINQNTSAIFVTRDNGVIKQVKNMCPNALIVNTPEILIEIISLL
jgi:hypothetical protein